MNDYRPELPPATYRIAQLPVHRGYPVPWFVSWLNDDGEPCPRGEGTPDFRVLFPDATAIAHNRGLCWICGETLGSHRAFVVGPMCVINRTSAEPPMHLECAEWSVQGCPFLTRPHMTRREHDKPAGAVEPAGIMLRRNPGVIAIWVTRKYRLRRIPDGGVLFDIGEPRTVAFYAEGRPATRAEIDASIESGLPVLRDLAEQQGDRAVRYLDREIARATALLPEPVAA